MDQQKRVWTQAQIDAANKRRDQNAPKSAAGEAHGDEGTDMPQEGDACTTGDGRSGYIFASGRGLECRASGEA